MKYIKDLHEEDGAPKETVKDKVEDSTSKASYWIIYKAGDKNRTKVDSFEGDDDEIEAFLKKKNEEGEEKYKAWTIEGLNLGNDEEPETEEK